MYYIALVNKEGHVLYPEHYEEELGRERRRYSYVTQSANEVGEWQVYMGEEPFECVQARIATAKAENESQEDFEVRLGIAIQEASKATTSILKPTMPDDEPEWHKLGYQTFEEYRAHNPKS